MKRRIFFEFSLNFLFKGTLILMRENAGLLAIIEKNGLLSVLLSYEKEKEL